MRFLKAYMVDIGEFLRQIGYLPPDVEPVRGSKRLPIISWTQAGNWQEICDTSQYGEYVETDAKATSGRTANKTLIADTSPKV